MGGIKTGSANDSCESRQERFSSDIYFVIKKRGREKESYKERICVWVKREKERLMKGEWELNRLEVGGREREQSRGCRVT